MSTLITETLQAQGFDAQPLSRDITWLIRDHSSFAITLSYTQEDVLTFKVYHFGPSEESLRRITCRPLLFLSKQVYTYTYNVEGTLKSTLTRLLQNKHLTANYILYDSAFTKLL